MSRHQQYDTPLNCLHESSVRNGLQEACLSHGVLSVLAARTKISARASQAGTVHVIANIRICGVRCALLNRNVQCLQAARTLMTDLRDQDDAAPAIPVIQKWLTWLAIPKVASLLDGHNGLFA